MSKNRPNKATREGFRKESTPQPERQRPPLAPVTYPIGKVGGDPSDFIEHAAKVLANPHTSIYVDTSFLTWLTKGSDESRQQFLAWAKAIGNRIHVPVWSYHEYYRHNGYDTLKQDIESKADHLLAAAANFIGTARTIADNPLKSGFSSRGYGGELDDLLAKIQEVTGTAKKWDYNTAAIQISNWMSERLCRSKVVFDLMNRLGDVGANRFTQDVPPGYLDRVKQDEKDKGSNKFGDLVLWEEVLAHTNGTTTDAVVILTRDRKADWFAPDGPAKAEVDLLELRGGERWNPIPAPHPTLLIELQERTLATDLVLLDELYFGAVLHRMGEKGSARLIAYSLDVKSSTYSDFVAKSAEAAAAPPARPAGPTLSKNRSKAILSALAPLQRALHPTAHLLAADAAINSNAPVGLQFVSTFDKKSLCALPIEEAAEFARVVCDKAQTDLGQVAEAMSQKLLTLLVQVKADLASAVFAGMLSSAYFETTGGARAVPKSPVLQDLFDQLDDPIYTPMLEVFNKNLEAAGSMALFKPKPGSEKLPVFVKFDANQQRIPVVLSEIVFGGQSLSREMGLAVSNNMRRLLGGKERVSVAALLELVANTYGLPLLRLEATDARVDDERTIPEQLGLMLPQDLGISPTPDVAKTETPDLGTEESEEDDSSDDLDDEMIDAQAEREEDSE